MYEIVHKLKVGVKLQIAPTFILHKKTYIIAVCTFEYMTSSELKTSLM